METPFIMIVPIVMMGILGGVLGILIEMQKKTITNLKAENKRLSDELKNQHCNGK